MDSPASRRYTRRLGQLLSSADGALTLAALRKLSSQAPPDTLAPPPRGGDTVGIWHRAGGRFVRDPKRRDEWSYWADVDVLPLRSGRRRVVLLGESVARGYLYDPGITLAKQLGECVRRIPGLADVDVLDLARTNAGPYDLVRTLVQATELEPASLVVFAGNNWDNIDLSAAQFQQLADAVRADGFPALKDLFLQFVLEHARFICDTLAAVATDVGASVVLIVPEFNLADWVDETSLRCPALPGTQQRTWLELREEARRASAEGRTADAARIAAEMTKLDRGTSSASQLLLAAALSPDDPEAATQALMAARDAPVGLTTTHSPRIPTCVQAELRRKAAEHGFALVDVAEVLRAAGEDPPPGRSFFLDYCHLTFEGLAATAVATATALAPQLGGEAPSRNQIRAGIAQPDTSDLAVAHLLAAVHNAHYGQPAGILRHHLAEALRLDPGVAAHMRNYLDYQTRVAPHWMCVSYERSASVPELTRYLRIHDPRITGKLADHALREATLDLLADSGGYPDLLVAEHAAGRVDLLADAARAATFRERFGYGAGLGKAFVVVPDLESDFHLVMAEPADTDLTITWRLPAGEPATGIVRVSVNHETVGSAEVTCRWTTTRLSVPAHHLRKGRNVIRIGWPLRALDGDGLLEQAADGLERGVLPEAFPGYGHVFTFTATSAAAAAAG